MYPDNGFKLEDLHMKVISDNGDGTETEMTVDEWKENHLVELNITKVEAKTLT